MRVFEIVIYDIVLDKDPYWFRDRMFKIFYISIDNILLRFSQFAKYSVLVTPLQNCTNILSSTSTNKGKLCLQSKDR